MPPESLTLREYQKNIIQKIEEKGSTLVVLPTGTGKTIIGFFFAKKKDECLFLAPTKPLVKQHYNNFLTMFPEFKEDSVVLTGETKERTASYSKKFIFATPQTIAKDLEKNQFLLNEKKLVIFDECHRTAGNYAYVQISKILNKNTLVIGLTASPGGKDEKIEDVLSILKIKHIEIRSGHEQDIEKHIQNTKMFWEFVSLTPEMRLSISLCKKIIKEYVSWFSKFNIKLPFKKSELLKFRGKLETLQKPLYYHAMKNFSVYFALNYLLEILQTQGFEYSLNYISELKKRQTKGMTELFKKQEFKELELCLQDAISKNKKHPKFYKLLQLLQKNKHKKLIVFVQYVSTIDNLIKFLAENNVYALKFTGKRVGFSRKEQQEILDKFRNNDCNLLIASSVGEEGIDVPSVDTVIFFDVVPSEIRSIQRRGRAGRMKEGEVYFIITSGTIELSYYRAAASKEKVMRQKLTGMGEPKEIQLKQSINSAKSKTSIEDEPIKIKKGQLKIDDFI